MAFGLMATSAVSAAPGGRSYSGYLSSIRVDKGGTISTIKGQFGKWGSAVVRGCGEKIQHHPELILALDKSRKVTIFAKPSGKSYCFHHVIVSK